jgi:hypothetical protein
MPHLCNSSVIIVNHQFIAFTKHIGEISAEADPRFVQWEKSRKKYWYS